METVFPPPVNPVHRGCRLHAETKGLGGPGVMMV